MDSENRKAYIWNSASGIISAGQSAVILIFISRYLGITEAGTFTIAYALANLVGVFAKYGVRNFQVTDIKEQYSLNDYLQARIISVSISILLLIGYLLLEVRWQKYTVGKAMVIFGICIWKLVDAMEDVFIGAYQQKGRLSVGACYYTLRLLFSTGIYCVFIICGFDLISSTAMIVMISIMLCVGFSLTSFRKSGVSGDSSNNKSVGSLMKICFPLCIGTTLANYIGNAPKYIIDNYMDDSSQAYFAYIMMPAFVILLLSNFIYQPLIRNLGVLWEKESSGEFLQTVFKQFVIVFGLTIAAIITGAWIGIPVLSFIYGVDLTFLKQEFLLLVIGGGAFALVSYLTVVLTTMRMQGWLAGGFAFTAMLYWFLGGIFANKWAILGVVLLYLVLNVILILEFTACLLAKVKHR